MLRCLFVPIDGDKIQCSRCKAIRPVPAEWPYNRECDNQSHDPDAPHPLTEPCQYLGAKLREGTCTACGMRGEPFDVHACAVHGECSVRRYRHDLRACVICQDYKAGNTNNSA